VIYFDTDTFRGIGSALRQTTLPDEVRRKIAISPIAAIEVLSQLSITDADKILASIHAMRKWLPERAAILDWPDSYISARVFGHRVENDDFRHIGEAFNACLVADKADQVKDTAKGLRDLLDRAKKAQTKRDRAVVEALRKGPVDWSQHPIYFAQGLANRVGRPFQAGSEAGIVERLSAFYEFQMESLRRALADSSYNFEKHQNRCLDGEQLVYLADPKHHFVTLDSGFCCVRNSRQRDRIHILDPALLRDANALIRMLSEIPDNV
jgi:hypothetical protein